MTSRTTVTLAGPLMHSYSRNPPHLTLPLLYLHNTPHTLPRQANCVNFTAELEKVFAGEIKKMQAEKVKPQKQITREPYERDHAVVIGVYRPVKKTKD